MSINVVSRIRKAIVSECMSMGLENPTAIRSMTVEALRGFGKMSVAGYKAHETIRRQNIARKLRKK